MIGAAVIGGGLMVVADFIGRTVAAPHQIPAALVGGSFLAVFVKQKMNSNDRATISRVFASSYSLKTAGPI